MQPVRSVRELFARYRRAKHHPRRYTITRITLGSRELMRDVELSWAVWYPQDWR